MKARERLPYDLRQLLSVLAAAIVWALPPCITAIVLLPKVEIPPRPPVEKVVEEQPETVLTAGAIVALVMVVIILVVVAWKTVIRFIRRYAAISIGCAGIVMMWGLLKVIGQYTMFISPLQRVFEVWIFSTAGAIAVYCGMAIWLAIGWRSKDGVRANNGAETGGRAEERSDEG